MALAGVIFDMDGVLCDSEPFILAAAQTHLRRRYGIEVPAEDFTAWIGAGDDAFVGEPARQHGVEPELPADKEATYDCYDELISGQLQALPGAIDFVTALQRQGVPTAIASSADRRKVRANLQAIGLPEAGFRAVVTGDDVQAKKPDPAAFRLAAAGMGCELAACLVVEDAVNGVLAARAGGARCLAIRGSFSAQELTQAGAEAVIADLRDVPAGLRRECGLA